MDKFFTIELMLLYGQISLERAEELIKAHIDIVESEWLTTIELQGAFSAGQLGSYA